MSNPLFSFLAAFSCMIAPVIAIAQPRAAVVELFTSQGCSSCPPAEAYLSEIAQRRDVLALAYHVDYWDDLGWRDRFSLPEATRRQREYVTALGLRTAYTPQAIIDGQENVVGSDRVSIGRSLAQARQGVAVDVAIQDGEVVIDISEQKGSLPSDVVLVPFLRSAVSPIGRGENTGRTIKEANIVRGLRSVGGWNGERRQFRIPVDSLPRDATDVAVLVQALGRAPIRGAATVALR